MEGVSSITAPSLLAMVPMVIFLIMTLMGKNYTFSVGIAAILGCILTGQGPVQFAGILVDNLGGTLGQVALIVMFGSGLGVLMDKAGINRTVVHFVVKKIGVNTEKKGMLAVLFCSLLMVVLIGTLNGGNAVIAPILLPIVASVGLTPTTVCFLMFNAGLVGVTVGPFCSAVAAALGVSGLSYASYMKWAALPYSITWMIITFILGIFIQKITKGKEAYEDIPPVEEYKASTREKMAVFSFIAVFLVMLVYGMTQDSSMKYVIFVILLLALVVGIFIDQPIPDRIKMFNSGMGKMAGMLLSFLLTGVMIDAITLGGGWEALSEIILNMVGGQSKYLLMIIASVVGGFGVEGAVVTQMEIVNQVFWPTASQMGISMELWAIVLVAAVRITSIVYPSANTAAHMGFARSNNMKLLIVCGWIISIIMLAFIPVWGMIASMFL
ncbi:MAG: hypothetical protein LUE86_12495 [Clostridiales bacterium]|nr:hypothetical protein [Clostridiales bacterium]